MILRGPREFTSISFSVPQQPTFACGESLLHNQLMPGLRLALGCLPHDWLLSRLFSVELNPALVLIVKLAITRPTDNMPSRP